MGSRSFGGRRLVREDVPFGFAVSGHEGVQDLILEREQVLEESLQLVDAALARLAEVLELVLQELLAGAAVEDQEDDVEEKPRLLDINLPVIGSSVDGGDV